MRTGGSELRWAHDSQNHWPAGPAGSLDQRRDLLVSQLLTGLDNDDQRRGPGAGLVDHAPELRGLAAKLLRSGKREDDIAGQFLQNTVVVGPARLNNYVIGAQGEGTLMAELLLDRAPARHLDDEARFRSHTSRLPGRAQPAFPGGFFSQSAGMQFANRRLVE